MRIRFLLPLLLPGLLLSAASAADLPGQRVEPREPLRLFRPSEKRPYPLACDRPKILEQILHRFAWAEKHTWRRGFVIERLENPRLRYEIEHGPSLIDHTHCQAEAIMTNGTTRTVYYSVEEGMGFASIGVGLDFCVLGLDPWFVHDAACRTVR